MQDETIHEWLKVDDNYVWTPVNLSEDLTRISSNINAGIKKEIE